MVHFRINKTMRKNKRGTNNSKKVHRQSGGIIDYSLFNPEVLEKKKNALNPSLEMSQYLAYLREEKKAELEKGDPSSFVNLTINIRLLTKRYIEALEQEIASNEKKTQELKTENENYEKQINKIQLEIDRLKDPPDGALDIAITSEVKNEWLAKIKAVEFNSDVPNTIKYAPPEVRDDRDVMLAAANRSWGKALIYASLNLLKQLANDESIGRIKDKAKQNLKNEKKKMESQISNYKFEKKIL